MNITLWGTWHTPKIRRTRAYIIYTPNLCSVQWHKVGTLAFTELFHAIAGLPFLDVQAVHVWVCEWNAFIYIHIEARPYMVVCGCVVSQPSTVTERSLC